MAIKIISKASLANRAAVNRGIEREIAIMKLINHPHVIRLYDVYETEKELYVARRTLTDTMHLNGNTRHGQLTWEILHNDAN